jgi:polyisoprenoid-binding protein YceI
MRALGVVRVRRGLIAGGIALVVLIAAGGATAWLLGSHHAPPRLALGSPTPAGAPVGLAGTWKVGAGSEAGYRVREQLIDQPSPTEAVARTSTVTGGFTIAGSGSQLVATGLHFSVDLASLKSQDRYATYQVYQRDFFIRSIYLQTDQYPTAVFAAQSVNLPAGIESGAVAVTVSGSLTVHGTTRTVTTRLQAQRSGNGIQVVGSIDVDMRDYNVDVPSIAFTKAEPAVVIEYQLVLVRT